MVIITYEIYYCYETEQNYFSFFESGKYLKGKYFYYFQDLNFIESQNNFNLQFYSFFLRL